jgi:phage-related protein
MAINIPIISSLDTKGFDKAKREFENLEGVGAKSAYLVKKAALPAAAAVGALGVAAFDAAKGAIEDAAAQERLAHSITRNTNATDAQIKANENWISQQGKLLGVTDDELRPAMAKLVTQTKSVTKAQELAALSMDIAAATGKPLATVTDAVAKAAGGNTKALAKLSPELKDMIKGGLDAEGAMSVLADTFGGAATTQANTAQGQFKRLQVSLAETKETIGAALLPIIEKILPVLSTFGNWASENTPLFLTLAGVIGGIAAAVLIVNGAMAAYGAITTAVTAVQTAFNFVMAMNPVTLVIIAVVALVAALVIAYKKFDGFRNLVDGVFKFLKTAVGVWVDGVKLYFDVVYGIFKTLFNGIASLWNNTVGKLSFKAPSWVPGIGGKGFEVPNIPMLAEGGIVTGPTLAMIGERGPEAVVPLDRYRGGGGDIYVTVQGGDPNAVVDALRRYQRQNGSIPIRVAS